MGGAFMDDAKAVQEYLNKNLSQKIRGDGGWVEFKDFDGKTLTLIFRAECSKCTILDRCEKWIQGEIAKDLGLDVVVRGIRKKPFFWDTVA